MIAVAGAVVTAYTTPSWLMDALQVTMLILVAAAATGVVLVRVPVRQVVALSGYGLLLAVLFLVFQAPDVTLSELLGRRGRPADPAAARAVQGPGEGARE